LVVTSQVTHHPKIFGSNQLALHGFPFADRFDGTIFFIP